MKPLPPAALQAAPKVSVLLPTYNRAHMLGRAIDSIRAQTLRDWELIVLDDGSTDETQDLMRRYCAKDSRIHYVRQPNGGQARAQNMGLRLARGIYLHTQDDDDAAYADKLAKCAAALDERADGDAVSVRWRIYRGTSVHGWHLFAIRHYLPLFFRTETVRRLGGWNEFYKLLEDMPLFLRIKKNHKANVLLKDILYDYRQSDDGGARHHRGLIAVWPLYQIAEIAMRPLYRWGLADMVQPHWDLRRAARQIYFMRRHAFLPSACYARWQKGTRAVFHRLPLQRQDWEMRIRQAVSSRSSWKVLRKAQLKLWWLSHHIGLPLRWRLQNGWSLAHYYFASRRQARMSKRRQARTS